MFNKLNLLNPKNSIVENPLKSPVQTIISQNFDVNQDKDEAENLIINSTLNNDHTIE